MGSQKDNRHIYLTKRSLLKEEYNSGRLSELYSSLVNNFEIAIIIPVKNEFPGFLKTLESLNYSWLSCLKSTKLLIITVVNSQENSPIDEIQNNEKLIFALEEAKNQQKYEGLDFFTINLNCKMPEKQGVGYARKIGMDYAIFFNCNVLACLDGDTLVEKNYVEALYQFSKDVKEKGELFAVTDFFHQKAENQFFQKAIDSYEGFLKFHSKKLKNCGTPFYPVALGPTLVSSNYAYCAVNGMNLKVAGEDFYFLQSLIKLKIAEGKNFETRMLSTSVFPSSRISNRVLFGTGSRINELVEEAKKKATDWLSEENDEKILENICYPFYDEWIYEELEKFITSKNPNDTKLKIFLEDEKFLETYSKIQKTYGKSQNRLEAAFHTWFDGLKIIRGIHFLERVEGKIYLEVLN